jgi:hypothetical protein
MKKNHLFILVITAIVGLMLVLPASAEISFHKYTPVSSTMVKPAAIRIPSVPIKNSSETIQPQLIPWKQTPLNPQFFKPGTYNRSGSQNQHVPTVIPVSGKTQGQPRDTWWGTVTVWNKDHSGTVPGASVTFYKFIFPEQHNSGPYYSESQGFRGVLIATGTTDPAGKLSINLFTGGYRIKAVARSPVISEDGEQVYYSGAGDLSYESHTLDISLTGRNKVQ